MRPKCGLCGGRLEEGYTSTHGNRSGPTFIVPGVPTSMNPLKAIAQGLADEPTDRAYAIKGWRCQDCGRLELFAVDPLY
jgi:hypothetical protein